MRNLILTLALVFGFTAANAQTAGDWYVGTGDVANTAWTEWAVSPTVGYGVMDNLMVGLSCSQAKTIVRDGDIKSVKIGKYRYVTPEAVHQYLDELNIRSTPGIFHAHVDLEVL